MSLDRYDLKADSNQLSFEFFSDGPKGKIKKIIQFKRLINSEFPNDLFNLGFGDFNDAKGKIDDLVVSNNNDSEKILATVAAASISFTDQHPEAYIIAQGSTPSRTRFYIMGISKNLKQVTDVFEIWGASADGQWEFFQKNKPYKALLAKRK